MPRSYLIRSEIHPYHVTSRVTHGDYFPLSLDEVWQIMLKELLRLHREQQLAIHAFVLMGNHFHLLCHTPKGNLDQIMQSFLRVTSVIIGRRAKTITPLWGSRYKWSIIESQTHYFQVYRYLYQNPVRAKMVSKVQDYPFSTLRSVPFPLHTFVPMSFGGQEGELIWLNERYEKEDEALIKLGLRRFQFDVGQRKVKAFNKLSRPNKESLD